MKKYIGIDIGGTNIKYGLIDELGNIFHHDKIKTSNQGKEILLAVEKIVKDYQKDNLIKSIGISCPGVVRRDGFLITGGAIMDFYNFPLKDILEKKLELPVTVENDANCAALAEKWQGASQEYENSLTVVVGTGIGGGIILNNQLFRGTHATAGEFGFMIVEPIKENDSRLATLSLTGSVECGIVQKYHQMKPNASANILNGKSIFDMSVEGDTLALNVMNNVYDRLAIGLFNLATAFDPGVILIGGAISENQLFMEELRKRTFCLKAAHKDMKNIVFPEIKPCKYQNQAGIIGAVYGAITMNKGENK